MGVPSVADRDSHALSVRENDAGSMPSRSSHAAMASGTRVVSTPPPPNTAASTEAVLASGRPSYLGRQGCARASNDRYSRDIGHPANRGPVGEPLQPVSDRVEGKPLAHQGLGQPVSDELAQLVVTDAHQSRVLCGVEAPVHADDRVVLDQ